MNDLKIMDSMIFDGNAFSGSLGAQMIFNCEDFNGTKQNTCYVDQLLNTAKLSKDALMCFDVFNYGDNWAYAINCVKQADATKSLTSDLIISKLNLKNTIKPQGFIYYELMKYYSNEVFCEKIIDSAKKNTCASDYNRKYKAN